MTVSAYRTLLLYVVVVSVVSASLPLFIATLITAVVGHIKHRKERK